MLSSGLICWLFVAEEFFFFFKSRKAAFCKGRAAERALMEAFSACNRMQGVAVCHE